MNTNRHESRRCWVSAILSLLALGFGLAWGAPAKAGRLTDDQVARWVLSANAGPNFVTFSEGGKVTQVIEPATLPAGKYDVISLSFTSLDQVTAEHLDNVGRLGRLGFLEFKDASALTAARVAALTASVALNTLIIGCGRGCSRRHETVAHSAPWQDGTHEHGPAEAGRTPEA